MPQRTHALIERSPGTGWEEIADYALSWATEQAAVWAARTPAASERVTDVRITHVGGPTALIAVDGWRLLTDPTFDDPAEGTPSAGARPRGS